MEVYVVPATAITVRMDVTADDFPGAGSLLLRSSLRARSLLMERKSNATLAHRPFNVASASRRALPRRRADRYARSMASWTYRDIDIKPVCRLGRRQSWSPAAGGTPTKREVERYRDHGRLHIPALARTR